MPYLLTRRQTLQSLASAAVLSSGLGGLAFSLAGCGGHGGNGGSGGRGRLRLNVLQARVSPPVGGSSPAAASLAVRSAGGSSRPDASGKAKVGIYNEGPQYVEAVDGEGNTVLLGFLGKGRATLDAASTAETLAYFALGGAALAGDVRTVLLGGLRGLSGFEAVVAAVEGSVRANGRVSPTDADLNAALSAMQSAFGGGRSRPGSSRGISSDLATASGLSLDLSVDDQFTITNVFLRTAVAWLDTVEYEIQSGTTTTKQTVDHGGPNDRAQFDIPMPKRYGGILSAIGDIATGDYAYSPTVSDPIKAPAATPGIEGCVGTKYKLTVVGPGLSKGEYDDLPALRQEAAKTVFVKAFLLDYLVPFTTTVVLPIGGDALDDFLGSTGFANALTDLINSLASTFPSLWQSLSEGKYRDALFTIRDSTWLSASYLPAVERYLVDWCLRSGDAKIASEAAEYLERGNPITWILGKFDLAVSGAEHLIIAHDLAGSNVADVFMITSRKGKVTLASDKSSLGVADTATVTAIVQNKNPDATYRYEWSVAPGEFLLTAPDAKNTFTAPGGLLVSNSDTVVLSNPGKFEGEVTATCKVTRIDGEPDVALGTATTSVKYETGVRTFAGSIGVFSKLIQGDGDADHAAGWDVSVAAVIVQLTDVEVASYSMKVIRPDGTVFKSAFWYPSNPYQLTDYPGTPNTCRYHIAGTRGVAYYSTPLATAAMEKEATRFTNFYANYRVEVTAKLK